jgi:hypothetical protein
MLAIVAITRNALIQITFGQELDSKICRTPSGKDACFIKRKPIAKMVTNLVQKTRGTKAIKGIVVSASEKLASGCTRPKRQEIQNSKRATPSAHGIGEQSG